jgi:hypothetical protein
MERRTFRHRPGSVDSFIEGAGASSEASEETAATSTADYPWRSARTDVQKLFNLRLPERHLLMLRFIAEHTPDTMQKFCLKHLLPAIETKIAELTQT